MSMKQAGIQEYLSFGYLYLLVLGIITEVIFYDLFGINILYYASISDILMSPISVMSISLILPVVIGAVVLLVYLYFRFLLPRIQKVPQVEFPVDKFLALLAITLLSFYLGIGVGRGLKLKQRLEEGSLKPTHVLTFEDSRTAEVIMIGQNSAYLFYALPPSDQVIVCPINNSIRQIVRIKRK